MSTVASKKRTSEAASLNNDAPLECENTTPLIPINVILDFILPFVRDRSTWNSICSANKELYAAGMRLTPAWPETKVMMMEQERVRVLKFSPCSSFLACGACSPPYLVYVYDRRGRQTCLRGHTAGIVHLSFSKDGNYLASAGHSETDTSIRIWPANSAQLPQQSEKTLQGHGGSIDCLDFSPDDSNLLASADSGNIKLWNVEKEACIYNCSHGNVPHPREHVCIRSMFFYPARDEGHECIFVRENGSLIQTSWYDLSDIKSGIFDIPGLGQVQTSAFSHCGSLLAAASPFDFLEASFNQVSFLPDDGVAVILYDMKTMSPVQRVSISDCMRRDDNFFSYSPDGKTLTRDFCDNVNVKVRLGLSDSDGAAPNSTWAVAFDPSGECMAFTGWNNHLRLCKVESFSSRVRRGLGD